MSPEGVFLATITSCLLIRDAFSTSLNFYPPDNAGDLNIALSKHLFPEHNSNYEELTKPYVTRGAVPLTCAVFISMVTKLLGNLSGVSCGN